MIVSVCDSCENHTNVKKKDKDLAGDMAHKDKELQDKEREGSKGKHKDRKEP